MNHQFNRCRLVLGDQLNIDHSWFQSHEDATLYLIVELEQEAQYTSHHVQKVCAFFAAMQAFEQAISAIGHHVLRLTLDDTQVYVDLPELLEHVLIEKNITCFEYQLPDEYRLREQLATFSENAQHNLNVAVSVVESEHFYLSDEALATYFKPGVKHRMEHFYRKMRTEFSILMTDDGPLGEQWNFDNDNRNKLKKADLVDVPQPLVFSNRVDDILERLERHNIRTIGYATPNLLWPVTQEQSMALLHFFCQTCLPLFGQFQDAMTGKLSDVSLDGENDPETHRGWSLYHARLSFSLNTKILSPKVVIETAIEYFYQAKGAISLAQIEGFVRQILGWREFIRGIYWANMPQYSSLNTLEANNRLPDWFWTGNTKMNCQHHAITQSLSFAYAHHIQRLMVTGNFCLLTGIDPDEVDQWYLGIYIDAIEWVELPNTRGMSQYADGGIVASKAYAASGNYINKMSDYCADCHYNVKAVVGENACPLNALYWHFMHKHSELFTKNPRTRMVYSSWSKKTENAQAEILSQAKSYLDDLNAL